MTDFVLPEISFAALTDAGPRRDQAVRALGEALEHTGFFALTDHLATPAMISSAYASARAFFALEDASKARYEDRARGGQRGYTSFGREHAKDAAAPDLKEFWQIGRTDVPDAHPVHAKYGPNVWPDEVPAFRDAMTTLYESLERMGRAVLGAAAVYLGEPEGAFRDAAFEGDTIVRVIHYPGLSEAPKDGAIRSAAHEDINFITLLVGATSEGLELLGRDGVWNAVRARHDAIIVDAGDMLQNLTNGVFRSTTHRVVIPHGDAARTERYSMPCFVHPRAEVSLDPLASCVARSGGAVKYPALTAGEFLTRRLKEIGLG
jgi:isopenicillin N synthase-like dioxygenase